MEPNLKDRPSFLAPEIERKSLEDSIAADFYTPLTDRLNPAYFDYIQRTLKSPSTLTTEKEKTPRDCYTEYSEKFHRQHRDFNSQLIAAFAPLPFPNKKIKTPLKSDDHKTLYKMELAFDTKQYKVTQRWHTKMGQLEKTCPSWTIERAGGASSERGTLLFLDTKLLKLAAKLKRKSEFRQRYPDFFGKTQEIKQACSIWIPHSFKKALEKEVENSKENQNMTSREYTFSQAALNKMHFPCVPEARYINTLQREVKKMFKAAEQETVSQFLFDKCSSRVPEANYQILGLFDKLNNFICNKDTPPMYRHCLSEVLLNNKHTRAQLTRNSKFINEIKKILESSNFQNLEVQKRIISTLSYARPELRHDLFKSWKKSNLCQKFRDKVINFEGKLNAVHEPKIPDKKMEEFFDLIDGDEIPTKSIWDELEKWGKTKRGIPKKLALTTARFGRKTRTRVLASVLIGSTALGIGVSSFRKDSPLKKSQSTEARIRKKQARENFISVIRALEEERTSFSTSGLTLTRDILHILNNRPETVVAEATKVLPELVKFVYHRAPSYTDHPEQNLPKTITFKKLTEKCLFTVGAFQDYCKETTVESTLDSAYWHFSVYAWIAIAEHMKEALPHSVETQLSEQCTKLIAFGEQINLCLEDIHNKMKAPASVEEQVNRFANNYRTACTKLIKSIESFQKTPCTVPEQVEITIKHGSSKSSAHQIHLSSNLVKTIFGEEALRVAALNPGQLTLYCSYDPLQDIPLLSGNKLSVKKDSLNKSYRFTLAVEIPVAKPSNKETLTIPIVSRSSKNKSHHLARDIKNLGSTREIAQELTLWGFNAQYAHYTSLFPSKPQEAKKKLPWKMLKFCEEGQFYFKRRNTLAGLSPPPSFYNQAIQFYYYFFQACRDAATARFAEMWKHNPGHWIEETIAKEEPDKFLDPNIYLRTDLGRIFKKAGLLAPELFFSVDQYSKSDLNILLNTQRALFGIFPFLYINPEKNRGMTNTTLEYCFRRNLEEYLESSGLDNPLNFAIRLERLMEEDNPDSLEDRNGDFWEICTDVWKTRADIAAVMRSFFPSENDELGILAAQLSLENITATIVRKVFLFGKLSKELDGNVPILTSREYPQEFWNIRFLGALRLAIRDLYRQRKYPPELEKDLETLRERWVYYTTLESRVDYYWPSKEERIVAIDQVINHLEKHLKATTRESFSYIASIGQNKISVEEEFQKLFQPAPDDQTKEAPEIQPSLSLELAVLGAVEGLDLSNSNPECFTIETNMRNLSSAYSHMKKSYSNANTSPPGEKPFVGKLEDLSCEALLKSAGLKEPSFIRAFYKALEIPPTGFSTDYREKLKIEEISNPRLMTDGDKRHKTTDKRHENLLKIIEEKERRGEPYSPNTKRLLIQIIKNKKSRNTVLEKFQERFDKETQERLSNLREKNLKKRTAELKKGLITALRGAHSCINTKTPPSEETPVQEAIRRLQNTRENLLRSNNK